MQLDLFYSVMQPMFGRIVRELQASYGIDRDCSAVLCGRCYLPEQESLGLSTRYVRAVTDYLDRGARVDLDYLREKEQQYGAPHLQVLISNDRFALIFDHDRALQFVEACLRVVEEVFDEALPDAVAGTLSYTHSVLAQGRGIPFLNLTPSHLNNRLAIIRNWCDRQDRVGGCFAGYKRDGILPELRVRAEALVEAFRDAKVKPPRLHEYTRVPTFNRDKLSEWYSLVKRRPLDVKDHLLAPIGQPMSGRVTRVVRAPMLDPGYFDQPVPGEKFVLFPLHLQSESTTLILEPHWRWAQLSASGNSRRRSPAAPPTTSCQIPPDRQYMRWCKQRPHPLHRVPIGHSLRHRCGVAPRPPGAAIVC